MTDETDKKAKKAGEGAASIATKAEEFLQTMIYDPIGKREAFGEPAKVDDGNMTDETDEKATKAEGGAASIATKAGEVLQTIIHDPIGKREAFGEPEKA